MYVGHKGSHYLRKYPEPYGQFVMTYSQSTTQINTSSLSHKNEISTKNSEHALAQYMSSERRLSLPNEWAIVTQNNQTECFKMSGLHKAVNSTSSQQFLRLTSDKRQTTIYTVTNFHGKNFMQRSSRKHTKCTLSVCVAVQRRRAT